MTGEEDPGDLGGRAAGQLEAERGGLVSELGVRTHRPGVRACLGAKGIEATASPGPDPAIEGGPAVVTHAAVRVRVRSCRDGAHNHAALGGFQPIARGLGDHRPAVQCHRFCVLFVHVLVSCLVVVNRQEA